MDDDNSMSWARYLILLGMVSALASCASKTPCQDAGPILWHKKFDGDKLCHQKQNSEGVWQNQGEFTWFYKDGTPALKGNYVDGKADGIWSEFNEKGEKTFERYFENGVEKTFMDPRRLKAMLDDLGPSSVQPAPLSPGQAASGQRHQNDGSQAAGASSMKELRGEDRPRPNERTGLGTEPGADIRADSRVDPRADARNDKKNEARNGAREDSAMNAGQNDRTSKSEVAR